MCVSAQVSLQIQSDWGTGEGVYSWAYMTFTLSVLQSIIPALDSVSTDLIRKYFRRLLEYDSTYLEGKKAGKEL